MNVSNLTSPSPSSRTSLVDLLSSDDAISGISNFIEQLIVSSSKPFIFNHKTDLEIWGNYVLCWHLLRFHRYLRVRIISFISSSTKQQGCYLKIRELS